MTVGQRIKERRIQLNMSQDELAKKMGYQTRNAIYQFEQKDNMKLSIVEKFASALDTTPAWLLGWEDDDGNIVGESAFVPQNDLNFDELSEAIRLYHIYKNADEKLRNLFDFFIQTASGQTVQVEASQQVPTLDNPLPQKQEPKPRAEVPHLKKDTN